jgi:hypothetical protein
MAGYIRSIVRKRTQGKSILVRILTLQQQFLNEVTAANVVHQIAELHTAKRKVAEILDDGAAMGVTVRLLELDFRETGKSFKEKWAQLINPQ